MDEAASEFERELLRSWEVEEPSAAAHRRVLGLAAGAGALGATSAAAATGAAGAILGAAAPRAASAGLLGIVKWFAAGVLIAGGTTLATVETRLPARGPATVPSRAIPPKHVALTGDPGPRVPAPPPSAASESGATEPVTPEPAVPVPSPTPRTSVAARAAVRTPAATAPPLLPATPAASATEPLRSSLGLGNEIAAVDDAQRALSSGNAGLAARLIDEYDARFPNGILSQEATVVRIEALAKQGRSAEARALAERFLEAHPATPHASRIRRLVDPGANP
jgi:hypothetical protein